jgi:hypothetical protein
VSKAAKSASAQKRKQQKKNMKAAQKARYEQYRDAGQNSKSKRAALNQRRTAKVRTERHATGPCGNTGCLKCQGDAAAPRLGHRAWLHKQRKAA